MPKIRVPQKLRSALQNQRAAAPARVAVFLGRTDGTIAGTRANFVWTTDFNGHELQVFNDVIPAHRWGFGLPLWIERIENSQTWQVVAIHQVYSDPVPKGILEHRSSHTAYGNDPVWVWGDQFMPWLCTPGSGLTLKVYRLGYWASTAWVAGATETLDMSASKPTSGARYALVEVNNVDGALVVTDGATVTAKDLLKITDIPAPTVGRMPLCAVRMYAGMTKILKNATTKDIVDLRFNGNGGGGGDMLKAVYDPNDDGIVVAADYATDAGHADSADNATTATTADSANAVRGKSIDPTLDPADGETLVWDDATSQFIAGSAGGGTPYFVDQAGGTGDTYGALAGAINGVNTTYTVSEGQYDTGTLVVMLNGQVQIQGSAEDWQETTPGSGTFDFSIAPVSGDKLLVIYQNGGGGGGGGGGGVWGEITGDISTQADLMALLPVTPDTPPTSPNAMDDEFPGTSLDAKWTEWNKQSGQVIEVSDGWLSLRSVKTLSSAPICAVTQPAPSGTWRVRAKLCIEAPTWNYVGVGLIARRTTGADKTTFGGVLWNSSYGTPTFYCGRTNGTGLSTETDCYNINTNPIYIELEYDGTNLIWRVSSSGWKFSQAYAEAASYHLGGAPEYVGIDLWAYADGSDNQGLLASCDWFRRMA